METLQKAGTVELIGISNAGMIPLTGTTSANHMREDLAVYDIDLSQAEVDAIEGIALS